MNRALPWIVLFTMAAAAPTTTHSPGPSTRTIHTMGAAGPPAKFLAPEPVTIPFDLHGNHIWMRGRLNDSDSLWMVLDTGASTSVMDGDLAKKLRFEAVGEGQAFGAGGVTESRSIPGVTIHLPGVDLPNQVVGTVPLASVSRQSGRSMDVVVGYPLFRNCAIEVDYDARVVRIWKGGSYQYRGQGSIVPITFIDNLPHVPAKVKLAGREAIAGHYVIDTGASSAVTLAAPFVEKEQVLAAVGKTLATRSGGVGGMNENQTARVDALVLGGQTLEQPIAILRSPTAGGRISGEGTDGNIGGDVLRRFKVTFDYPRKRMILEPGAAFREPFEADMSGLVLHIADDSTAAMQVVRTQSDSPAAEAGFTAGDVIEQVDGQPVEALGITTLREMFRRPGETHRFGVRRGESRLELSLTTRRMI